MSKGFIFSGDSFVWGEGLELFSNLPSTKKYFDERKYSMEGPYNRAWNPEYKNSMRLYQQKHRFPRLVADYFNTWEDVYDRNGGCPYSIIDELLVQIDRTPLTDISSIIIHPTSIWRSVDICLNSGYKNNKKYRGLHPVFKYFTSDINNDTGNLSKFYLKEPISYFGTNLGFKKYEDLINDNFFSEVENQWYSLLMFSFSYSKYKEGKIDIHTALTDVGIYPDTSAEKIEKYEIFLDFCKLETSHLGNDFSKILKYLEIKLCKDFIDFIEKYIKPNADKFGVNISFLPTWNDTWVSYKNAGSSFYNKNIIEIYKDNKYYPSFHFFWDDYMIDRTPGFEWTNNMHPNLEGHKLLAKSIIHYFEKNNTFS